MRKLIIDETSEKKRKTSISNKSPGNSSGTALTASIIILVNWTINTTYSTVWITIYVPTIKFTN